MADKETIKMIYSFGDHPVQKDTIVITVSGTGINVTDAEHKQFMDVLMKVIASQMYAKVNNIPIDNVKF